MGKTGRWIRNLLTGKREKERESRNESSNPVNEHRPTTPTSITQPTTPKEKRRWSFRRSSAAAGSSAGDTPASNVMDHHIENDPKRHALAVAVATEAAASAAMAAAKAAAAVMQLTTAASNKAEEAAATKIQAVFRASLARKALNALKGLVKLQALVRGHLVRKQATATLRCMQALVTVQARARAQRLRMAEETKYVDQIHLSHRKSTHENRLRNSNQQDLERSVEENIKIVEMDLGDYKPLSKGRNSYSNHTPADRSEHRNWTKQEHYHHHHHQQQQQQQISPVPSAITDISPRTCSNHFEDYSLQSSPQCYSAVSKPDHAVAYPRSEYAESLYSEYPFYPNYMANTQSSRAKVRSHSAPKQRPAETFERQPSTTRRRPSIEGRNVPRAVRMQRSSSHVGSAPQNYHYPWSVKLDRSAVSLKDSECGSTSTVLTNNNYCRSLAGFEVQGARY